MAKAWPDGPLVFGHDKEIAEFVRQRTPQLDNTGFGDCVAIGVIRFGKLIGGVVYNNTFVLPGLEAARAVESFFGT